MPQTINELLVKVSADIKGMQKGLAIVTSETSKTEKNVNKSLDKIKSGLVSGRAAFNNYSKIAVAAITAVGVATIKTSLDSIDAQAKFADRIGISTEALGGLQHAADLTGVSTQSLNTGLQRMTRRVSEAAQGTGTAKKALEELGVSAQELNRLSPDEQFGRLATAMENVTGQSDKVRISMALFDTEGVALVNTLKLGEQGLKDMTAEAVNFGIAINRFDASQVENANDAIARAKAVVTGFGRAITVEVAPFLQAMSESFVENANRAGGFGVVARNVITGVASGVGVMADGIKGLEIIWEGAKLAGQGFGLAIVTIIKAMTNAIAAVGNTIKNGLIAPLKGVLAVASNVSDEAKGMLVSLNGLSDSLDIKPSKDLEGFFSFMLDSVKETKIRLNDMVLEGLPSDKIKSQVNEIFAQVDTKRAEFEAKPIASQVSPPGVPTANGEAASSDGESAAEKAARAREQQVAASQAALEALREGQSAELEAILMHGAATNEAKAIARTALLEQIQADAEAKQEVLNTALLNEQISIEEAKLRENQIWKDAEDERTRISADAVAARQRLDKLEQATRTAGLLSSTAQSIAIIANGSKKAFKVAKAFAIAEGVLNIATGVTKALNNPYPANLAFAASVAASGAALMSTIRGASPGSGGSVSAPSAGASVSSSVDTGGDISTVSATPAVPQRNVVINLQGKTQDTSAVRELIEAMQDEINEGNVQFNITGDA